MGSNVKTKSNRVEEGRASPTAIPPGFEPASGLVEGLVAMPPASLGVGRRAGCHTSGQPRGWSKGWLSCLGLASGLVEGIPSDLRAASGLVEGVPSGLRLTPGLVEWVTGLRNPVQISLERLLILYHKGMARMGIPVQ